VLVNLALMWPVRGITDGGVMEKVWEELGYQNRYEMNKDLNAQNQLRAIKEKKRKQHFHEKQSVTLLRKAENLAKLSKAFNQSFDSNKSMVTVYIQNRKIDIWPSSGVWYSHSKKSYGTGIDQICKAAKQEGIRGK